MISFLGPDSHSTFEQMFLDEYPCMLSLYLSPPSCRGCAEIDVFSTSQSPKSFRSFYLAVPVVPVTWDPEGPEAGGARSLPALEQLPGSCCQQRAKPDWRLRSRDRLWAAAAGAHQRQAGRQTWKRAMQQALGRT